jgi:hypothetical protein
MTFISDSCRPDFRDAYGIEALNCPFSLCFWSVVDSQPSDETLAERQYRPIESGCSSYHCNANSNAAPARPAICEQLLLLTPAALPTECRSASRSHPLAQLLCLLPSVLSVAATEAAAAAVVILILQQLCPRACQPMQGSKYRGKPWARRWEICSRTSPCRSRYLRKQSLTSPLSDNCRV